MTRGKQKIDARRAGVRRGIRNPRDHSSRPGPSASKLAAPSARIHALAGSSPAWEYDPPSKVRLANQNQLVDHYGSKHPKEKLAGESGG